MWIRWIRIWIRIRNTALQAYTVQEGFGRVKCAGRACLLRLINTQNAILPPIAASLHYSLSI
jgi:hypothetical protein